MELGKKIVEVEDFVKVVEDFVNTGGMEKLRMSGEELARMHPTLQQNFMRVVVAFIKAQSEKKYFDARNEATVELCRELWDVLSKSKYFFKDNVILPFI